MHKRVAENPKEKLTYPANKISKISLMEERKFNT